MRILTVLLLLFLLLASFCYSQDIVPPGYRPFAAGNDTLFASTVLTSIDLSFTNQSGAASIGLEFTKIGDSASYVDVYYKSAVGGLSWGVPFDSLGVDSIYIARVDSQYVNDGDAFWINLAGITWWGYHDRGKLILVSPADLDSVSVNCNVKGLKQ